MVMVTPSFLIGIAGGTGAGKTTVAEKLVDELGAAATIIRMDNYYKDISHLSPAEREERNYDHPDAFDWDLLHDQLSMLMDGEPVQMPQYDFTIHNRTDERVMIKPTDTIIVEGILALHDQRLHDQYDLSIYVMTDADVRILRRIRRDVVDRGRDLEGVIDQYLDTVKPMHERFIEPTKKHADIIIPEGHNPQALDLLIERARAEHG